MRKPKTTLTRINRQLKNLAQTAKQVREQEKQSHDITQDLIVDIDEMGQNGLDLYYEAQRIKKQVGADLYYHRKEALEASITLEDKLNDILTILGAEGKNLAFLQAASPVNLSHLVNFIVKLPAVFQEVMEQELSEEEFAVLEDVIEKAKQNRLTQTK